MPTLYISLIVSGMEELVMNCELQKTKRLLVCRVLFGIRSAKAAISLATVLHAATIVAFFPLPAMGNSVSVQVECDVHAGPCTTPMGNGQMRLNITPKPVKAMRDLVFTLTLKDKGNAGEPYIDLGMPGMDMGKNRVSLKPTGEGVYEGKGIIVRCPSGRRTWRARVMVPHMEPVDFIFDVIY
jgi:hypothetical protein